MSDTTAAPRPSLAERLRHNADGILEQIARDYAVSIFEVVRALPEEHRAIVAGDRFEPILQALTHWGEVLFIVHTKSSVGKGKGGERVSASSGTILSYAAKVRARVAGNRPAGGGLRGTAVVAFGVTPSGGVAYVSVARSSGNCQIDQLVVAAVRGAGPFPAPPAGAAPGQLRFSIPFHFQ
jgi:TonB family protein